MSLNFKVGKVIGRGGFAMVLDAEENSGIYAAIKKSRVSLRVKRTMIRHEARVLQLLQGHPAIPTLFGYQRLPHFEYIAVDLLGQNMKKICKPGHCLKIGTVACIAEQMLSALEHLNAHHIVHRDIKPEHILLCLSDPSRVCLVDFGIAQKLTATEIGPIHLYNPVESNRNVVGTLNWCSINAHLGYDLRPYDDVESLAYSLLYLLMGGLPWRLLVRRELAKRVMLFVLGAKSAFTIPAAIPAEFHDLLKFARMAQGDITDNLADIRVKMKTLASNVGETPNNPLDLTLEETVFIQGKLEFNADSNSDSDGGSTEEPNEEYSNSYWGVDIDCWDMRAVRDRSLTLPPDEAGKLDGAIPEIVVIDRDWTIG